MQNRYAIQGHLTGSQMQSRMMSSNVNTSNASGVEPKSTDIELGDIEVEDVSPIKKEVPFLTKKGKLVLAFILVSSTLYYIWLKHKSNTNTTEAPVQAQAPTEQPAPTEAPSQNSNEVTQNINEQTV